MVGIKWWYMVLHTGVQRRADIEPLKFIQNQYQLCFASHVSGPPLYWLSHHQCLYSDLAIGSLSVGS